MKLVRYLAGLLIIGATLWLAYNQFFPNEEKRIRKMLDQLAQASSIPAKKTPVAAFVGLDRFQWCFTPDVEVILDIPLEARHTFTGREELVQGMQGVWARLSNIQVSFFDVSVNLEDSKEAATAELTAKVAQAGERDFLVQGFRLHLKKEDKGWRISRVESVKVLH